MRKRAPNAQGGPILRIYIIHLNMAAFVTLSALRAGRNRINARSEPIDGVRKREVLTTHFKGSIVRRTNNYILAGLASTTLLAAGTALATEELRQMMSYLREVTVGGVPSLCRLAGSIWIRLQTKYARNGAKLADERCREQIASFVDLSTAEPAVVEASASESNGLRRVAGLS